MRWLGLCCAGLRVPGSREADLRTNDGSYVTYSPGITNTTQTVTAAISESYSCGPLGSVTSGSGSLTISFPATTVTRAADGTTTIVSVGTVTSGLGQGEVATRTVVLPRLNPDECGSAQGVTQESVPPPW
jgi:hypothetical protein